MSRLTRIVREVFWELDTSKAYLVAGTKTNSSFTVPPLVKCFAAISMLGLGERHHHLCCGEDENVFGVRWLRVPMAATISDGLLGLEAPSSAQNKLKATVVPKGLMMVFWASRLLMRHPTVATGFVDPATILNQPNRFVIS